MTLHRVMRLAAALSWLVGADAQAQAAVPLEPGSRLRVLLADRSIHEGRLVTLDEEVLALDSDGERRFATSDVDQIWLRQGRGRSTASTLGLIYGAGFAGLGMLAYGDYCGESAPCTDWGSVALLGLAGAAVGALMGGAIGSVLPRWDLRYTRGQTADGLFPDHVGTFTLRFRTQF